MSIDHQIGLLLQKQKATSDTTAWWDLQVEIDKLKHAKYWEPFVMKINEQFTVIDSSLVELKDQMEQYPKHSQEYRDSLQKELELIQQKIAIVDGH